MERYYGLIEVLFTFGAFLAFYIWQMRALKKSVAEREAREAREAQEKAEREAGERDGNAV